MIFKSVLILFAMSLIAPASSSADDPALTCGNVNLSAEGQLNLADITRLIDLVYLNGEPLLIQKIGNVDGSPDDKINLADITHLICMIYLHICEGNCPPLLETIPSECLTVTSRDSSGGMHVDVIDNNLHIFNTGAHYQCCLQYDVEISIDRFDLVATERDMGRPCDCYCYFDLESVVYLLAPGQYQVTLVGLEGEIVGVDTAIILGDFELVSWENSECGAGGVSSQVLADVIWTYSGGELALDHANALFNCGLELEIEVVVAGDTIRVFERNVMPFEGRFKCNCFYQVSTLLTGVEPQGWVLEVYQNDLPLFGYPDELVNRQTIYLSN